MNSPLRILSASLHGIGGRPSPSDMPKLSSLPLGLFALSVSTLSQLFNPGLLGESDSVYALLLVGN